VRRALTASRSCTTMHRCVPPAKAPEQSPRKSPAQLWIPKNQHRLRLARRSSVTMEIVPGDLFMNRRDSSGSWIAAPIRARGQGQPGSSPAAPHPFLDAPSGRRHPVQSFAHACWCPRKPSAQSLPFAWTRLKSDELNASSPAGYLPRSRRPPPCNVQNQLRIPCLGSWTAT
jgi:hypothetical protein